MGLFVYEFSVFFFNHQLTTRNEICQLQLGTANFYLVS